MKSNATSPRAALVRNKLQGPSYLKRADGKFLGCVGQSFVWTDSEMEAIIFTPDNLGRQRADDFHVNALGFARGPLTPVRLVPPAQ